MVKLVPVLMIFALISNVWADTIYFKRGGTRSGVKILAETSQHIEYSINGQTGKVRGDIVSWVEYSDAPRSFIEGRQALQKGYAEEAVYLFEEALKLAADPLAKIGPWMDIYGTYYAAKAYQVWADSDPTEAAQYNKAVSYYQKALQKAPDHRFTYDCLFELAQCLIQLKKIPGSN